MKKKYKIIITAAAVVAAVSALAAAYVFSPGKAAFGIDASKPGDKLPNIKSNVNIWNGRFSENPSFNEIANPYDFVDYVQLMQCSGGNAERDLFKDPADFSVTDDYDFDPLITSCRGVLKAGAKPVLKLGNVPEKLSAKTLTEHESKSSFGVNVYPPDDYAVYDAYIRAMATALRDAFGAEEVRSWRFGVLTEYENADWFMAPGGDSKESFEAYCELYDHTANALESVLGKGIFIGAHSMSVSEGLWDERDFIRHCAEGVNYATGEKGAPLKYLSASFYVGAPGDRGDRLTLPQTIAVLKQTAEECGFNDLIYGVDEGRVLVGLRSGKDSDELLSRTVGYTYQAGFDAQLAKQAFDSGLNYFSSWAYCSEGMTGLPLITYHFAQQASLFENMSRLPVDKSRAHSFPGSELEAVAASDESSVRIMIYNFKDSLKYSKSAGAAVSLTGLNLPDGKHAVTLYEINDDCNWFDEWQSDAAALGIKDEDFSWSPDDGNLTLISEESWKKFRENEDKYRKCSELKPRQIECEVVSGSAEFSLTIAPNAVTFAVIEK